MPQFSFGLFLFIFLLTLFSFIVEYGAVKIALYKMGLSTESATLLFTASLIGSMINLPLKRIQSEAIEAIKPPLWLKGMLKFPLPEFRGETTIAINIGGGLIPACLSVYLLIFYNPGLIDATICTGLMTLVCYWFSRPVRGLGIGMPVFIAPLSAALFALSFSSENAAVLAYISGTLGVIIGADLLRIKDIRKMGTPVASIGGAGTFDGIYITGLVAVLLT